MERAEEGVTLHRGRGVGMAMRGVWSVFTGLNDILYTVIKIFCAVFLTGLIVTVFIQVFGRYVLRTSTPWSEETAIYCFIWMVLMGSALGVRDHSHLVADLLPESMGPFLDKLVLSFTHVTTAILAVVFAWFGYEYAILSLTRYSDTMGFPMFYINVSVPVSGVAMLLFVAERLIDTWTSLDAPDSQERMEREKGRGG